MPGISGIIGKKFSHFENIFSEMQKRALLHSWYIQKTSKMIHETHDVAFIQTGLGILEQRSSPMTKAPEDDIFVVVCGEIFNINEIVSFLGNDAFHGISESAPFLGEISKTEENIFLRTEKNAEASLSYLSPSALILAAYRAKGKAFFPYMNGRFQAAIYDGRKQCVILTSDRFGTRPLYWTQTPERFLFAAEIKTLLADMSVSREENISAITDFLTFGHYLHQETSLKSVQILPPAAWYEYSINENRLCKDVYWHPTPVTLSDSKKYSVSDVADAFCTSVRQQSQNTPDLGISLSGGLDARSILGLIPDSENITSVALGVPGSADHLLASQLAKLAKTKHYNYELNTDFLMSYENHMAEMVRLTDGQYLSSCIVIPTLPFYRQKKIGTLLRGHAGELMHMSKAYAFSLTQNELRNLASPDDIFRWALSHLQAYMLDGVNAPLLKGISPEMFQNSAQESLRKALQDANMDKNLPPVQTIWTLYLRQRVYREIPLSMRKFDSQVNIRLPFLDNQLADMLLALPPELKMAETIQKTILEKYRPAFLNVKNVNTGTFIGAGYFRQKFSGLRHKIFAKLGFPGYQPYEKMGLWLRRELSLVVKSLLLSDKSLERGTFNPDTVRKVVSSHFAGENHTYLLLAMMISEQRARFFDS
ncbi:MAG: asparagine synthase-related protein [Planctomycetia bacterium]|nr:asparagine synthase-related protein [Planctomycetia bacterium]